MNSSIQGLIAERYQTVHKAGEGGMGELYLARDLKLNGALRAIKILKHTEAQLEQGLEQEALILTRLQHRCLPIIYDYTSHQSRPCLVMEWINGIHLGQLLNEQSKPLPLSYIFYVLIDVLEALAYLHTQQPPIIHRDLKPSNIMLANDGTIKLIDFGISKQLGKNNGSTVMFGTRGYSSPEQLSGKPTDERTDIYSFGALLLRMLGLDPTKWIKGGKVERSLLRKLLAFPKGLRELIVDCIQEQPLHRPQSIDDVLHRMKKLQLLHGGELQNKSGKNAYYVGKRIAVLSAHKGAGATLVSLSLRELYQDRDRPYSLIEHRLDEGELCYHYDQYRQSEHSGSGLELIDEAYECATVGAGRIFMINPLNEENCAEDRLQHTVELTASLALQHDVIIDYSSHWNEKELEYIVQHADLILLVDSPWTLKQSPRSLYRIHQLLQQANRSNVTVRWIHNRDQSFHGRSSWKSLAGELSSFRIPELPAKQILKSICMQNSYPPYQDITRQIKKYLMSLIK